jgi:hypothetical protein
MITSEERRTTEFPSDTDEQRSPGVCPIDEDVEGGSTLRCLNLVKRRSEGSRKPAETAEYGSEARVCGHPYANTRPFRGAAAISAAPVLVHGRPQPSQARVRSLGLRHDDTACRPAKAEVPEGRAEERAVHEVDRDRRFRTDASEAAEKPAVRIPRNAQGTPECRLGGRPYSAATIPATIPHRPASISSPLWRPSSDQRRTLTLAATVLGSSLVFIDATVVFVALPTIAEDLTWVSPVSSDVLHSLARISPPVGGAIGDRGVGRRVEPRAFAVVRSSPASLRRAASSFWRALYKGSRAHF